MVRVTGCDRCYPRSRFCSGTDLARLLRPEGWSAGCRRMVPDDNTLSARPAYGWGLPAGGRAVVGEWVGFVKQPGQGHPMQAR
jgi:hypothetical protein